MGREKLYGVALDAARGVGGPDGRLGVEHQLGGHLRGVGKEGRGGRRGEG